MAKMNPSKYKNMSRTQVKGPRPFDKRGEDLPFAKLTEAEVLEIRADTRSKRAIARDYGIVHSTVIHIQQRRIWSHI